MSAVDFGQHMEASSSHENPPLGQEAHALQRALGDSLAEERAEPAEMALNDRKFR